MKIYQTLALCQLGAKQDTVFVRKRVEALLQLSRVYLTRALRQAGGTTAWPVLHTYS